MNDTVGASAHRMVWGVAALLQATGDALSARFGAVAVRGELSGLLRAASGHIYFVLKDSQGASALIRCAMFRRAAALMDFSPVDGQQVEVLGRLGLYEPRGELQMVVESMRRLGAGTLYEEFLRLRQLLQSQGLFDTARKRNISKEPRAIGVVTSLGAAALHDVLTALARRAPHVRVVVYPSLVQGAQAPDMLRQALALANRRREVDTLLLVRGGGSMEDLWAFNDEALVRAVAASALPVVCGVGHETDVTLCDLAADLRAPTPTAAAELAAPDRLDLHSALERRAAALRGAVMRAAQTQAQRLDRLSLRLGAPAAMLSLAQQRLSTQAARLLRLRVLQGPARWQALAQWQARLSRAKSVALQLQVQQLSSRQTRMAALNPQQVLERGFVRVESVDGRPVVSVNTLQVGEPFRAVWRDGQAMATFNGADNAEQTPDHAEQSP